MHTLTLSLRTWTRMRVLLLLMMAALLGACASQRINLKGHELAAEVDLQRYAGRWYVIANIPYFAERGKVGSYVEYILRDDGRIDDLYFFRRKELDAPVERWDGIAWVIDGTGNAAWKAQFIWPFAFDYLILAVDEDYQWALVGHPDRKLAWVFSRSPQMDEALYQRLLARLAAQGYDPKALQRIAQLDE